VKYVCFIHKGFGRVVLALHPRVVDAVWTAVAPLLPSRPVDRHPLGCHRPRIADRVCFTGILVRLVTGCSWEVAGRLVGVSETTLRRRRDEWVAAGVFEALCDEAIAGYERIIGLDLSEVSIDGSVHKAPCGGQGTGRTPTDRGKLGWKWSLATDRWGDAATGTRDKPPLGLGLRWAVERSNSWFSNFGQLRRNTDRRTVHRLAQIALTVALILTVKLVKWAQRWSRPTPT
jgi:hypothetical protein